MNSNLMAVRRAGAAQFVLCAVAFVHTGCSLRLMPTPNLYVQETKNPFADVPASQQSSQIDVIYVTDREPIKADSPNPSYGSGRSQSMAVGTAKVEIGQGLDWPQVMAQSRSQARPSEPALTLSETKELARFDVSLDEDAPTKMPKAHDPAADRLHDLVARRLAESSNKDAFVFIHGYNYSFFESAAITAEMWHFLGRRGVPIDYSWPSGLGGPTGYAYDRESGEFTVFHLKQFLRALAKSPGIRRIHILAHSRGADVLMTALRELHIEFGHSAERTRQMLRLGQVVLAAADMDLEVATQRIAAERIELIPERLTVYYSLRDRALRFAGWMFSSFVRIGGVSEAVMTPRQLAALAKLPRLNLIRVDVETNLLGHDYFISSPAVSSDIILVLRDERPPGAEFGRPLIKLHENLWKIVDGYPGRAAASAPASAAASAPASAPVR